ncbi:MAG: Sfum_1244 family protein [Thermodesulfovibrionales bacterium]
MDLDIEALSAQIKVNCDISDARFWGNYSICGLLLRLRELFRHERGVKPWEEIPQGVISEWIASKESLWHEIEEREFNKLSLQQGEFPPFESEGINHLLEKEGLLYGAGLGIQMKPSFFLAELHSKKSLDEYEVIIAGRELVRDLSAYPSVLQRDTIVARRDALTTVLWDKFEEIRPKKYTGTLLYAFSQYGIDPQGEANESLYARIAQIAEEEIGAYIYHEIGEAHEGSTLGELWKTMLSGPLTRRAELFVRSIKDVLSDTSDRGMLKYIVEHRRKGSLGFYLSSLGGFRKMLFPEIQEMFPGFTEREDWKLVEKARKKGYEKAGELASSVLDIYRRLGEGASDVVEKELIDKMLPRL